MSEPWLDYQGQEDGPWNEYAGVSLAKPAPRQDTYQLWQQAQAGDPAAVEAYNTRARTYGQNTLEQDREQNSPVAGQSFIDNTWQSVGRYWPNLARNFDSPEEVDRARQLDDPLLQTGGGLTGSVASNTAMLLAPQNKLTTGLAVTGKFAPYLSAGIVGGAAGAAEPVGSGESRSGNAGRAAIWGVGGQGAGDIVGAGAKFLTPTMTRETSDLLDTAYSLGIRPDIGQVSKNPLTKQFWNQMGRLPLSGQGGRTEANQVAFNKVVSEAYGVPAEKITSEVHSKAVNALSSEFERLKAATKIPVAPTFISEIKAAKNKVRQIYGSEASASFDYWANDLIKRSKNGVISGPDYQAWSSELSEKMPNLTGDRKAGAGEIAKYIESQAASGLNPADKKAWSAVRQKWAVMKQVEPLVAKNAGTGDIPPAQLLGAVTRDEAGKVRVARGKGGTLAEAAEVGQRFLKEPADSGTAGRVGALALVQNVARNPYAQAGGLAGGAYAADQYNIMSPGQIGGIAGLLLANRAGLKVASAPSVIRGAPQRIVASSAKKVLPRVAIPYALSQPVAAEDKKKPKRP